MATFTLTRVDRFPAGTEVGIYAVSDWLNDEVKTDAAPPGIAVATETMGDTEAVFTLADDTAFVAYAEVEGQHRYVAIGTFLPPRIDGSLLEPGTVGADALAPSEAWHEVGTVGEPAFQNAWANFIGVAGFYIDPLGIARLRGFVNGTTLNTTVFTLPAGYRPEQEVWFNTARGGGTGGALIRVGASGTVDVVASAGTAAAGVSLAGISFRAT